LPQIGKNHQKNRFPRPLIPPIGESFELIVNRWRWLSGRELRREVATMIG
jgi:hypothetical protein